MKDPVTGFKYPKEWIKACTEPEKLSEAAAGRAILTSSGKVLIRGITTGTTAAAACKAAVLSLKKEVTEISIITLSGVRVNISVKGKDGTGFCSKYSGDYPNDVTDGIVFCAEAHARERGVSFHAGTGIGRWHRENPRYKKGSPAISSSAMQEIDQAITEALYETGIRGVSVELFVPEGGKIARRTLNERVGVSGGISVLGTTGLVEPWDDHLEEAVFDRVSKAEHVVLTTGRIGMRYAGMLFPDHEIILVGSKLKKALENARNEVIICGLPALILKFINPNFLVGTGYATVEEMTVSPIFYERMNTELEKFKKQEPLVRVVLINRKGEIIGESP